MLQFEICRIKLYGATPENDTPAMAAGVTDHVLSLEEIVGLLETAEPKGGKRGPFKERNYHRRTFRTSRTPKACVGIFLTANY